MNKSRLVSEEKLYVKFDENGNTEVVNSNKIQPGFKYRHVHDSNEQLRQSVFSSKADLFVDKEYQIKPAELAQLDPKRTVILKRLSDLCRMCPKSCTPMFFPRKDYIPPRKLSSNPYLPTFATQMGVFPVEQYKSFFITQNFSQNGFYHVIINQMGRFETDVVDDIVPVYEDSLEPIWDMDLDQCWQIILLKFWAKRSGGYDKVKSAPAFNFLECFSNSNWKYYNLQKEGYGFLDFYTGKVEDGRFILKTKNSNMVREAGLIPGSAGYTLVNLIEKSPNQNSNNIKDKVWVATIRSTMTNKWTGNLSVLDKEINQRYQNQKQPLALDRDFMLNHADLLNLFSTCYIGSKRGQKQAEYISDYYVFQVEPNNKSSIYIKFNIEKDGWLDFCVKQAEGNKVAPITAASRLKTSQFNKAEGINDGMRYLKCRFILVKENNQKSPSTFTESDYEAPAYDTYQIQYLKGYNRGDARFLNVVKGTYILKIKPEQIKNRASHFILNYASSSYIEMKQYFPEKKETSAIMRQSMASLIGLMTCYHLDTTKKDEQIVYGNVFEEIGYGFVGIRSKKICPYRILMEVDPKELQKSGYKVKNIFKKIEQPFSILISPGECTSIVLKKIPDTKYVWPPNGIQIYRER